MAKANIEIYLDETDTNDNEKMVSKSVLPKTPLKLGSRIPLTPARRNNQAKSTPAKNSSKLLKSSQPIKLKEVENNLSSLPEIETFSRVQPSLSKEISEIQLDEIEKPKMIDTDDELDELELEMLCMNQIDTATRLQKSLAQEIADISLDSIEKPSFWDFGDENDEDFVITL